MGMMDESGVKSSAYDIVKAYVDSKLGKFTAADVVAGCGASPEAGPHEYGTPHPEADTLKGFDCRHEGQTGGSENCPGAGKSPDGKRRPRQG